MLNPYLLWFLPLVLVPILLHLLSLRRLRTVELSTFRFLMDSYVQQRRKVKLLEFLLMFLRTVFVLLIVLTLSRPVVERFGFLFGGSGRSVVLILDSGASMALRTGATTSFERACGAARTVLEQLGDEDHVTLIEAGQYPRIVEQRFAGRNGPIRQQLSDMEPGAAVSDLGAALETALSAPRRGARVVYILTDGNRAAWTTVAGHPALEQLEPDDKLVVMNLGPSGQVRNLAAVGEPPAALQPIVGLPVVLHAAVVNSSGQETVDTVLTCTIDNEEVARFNLSLRPGERARLPVPFTPQRAGVIRGQFKLPSDAFSEDDAFLFCLNVQPGINVALVSDTPKQDEAMAAGLFVRAALESPRESNRLLTASDAQIAAALNVTELPAGGVSLEALQSADVVILTDVALQRPAPYIALRQYVESGGGLLVFPGPATDVARLCDALFGEEGQPLPGPAVRLREAVGDPDDETAFQPVSGLKLAHPVLRAFDEEGAEFFGTVRVWRHYPIEITRTAAEPDDTATEAQTAAAVSVLMRLPDRTPLLTETHIGRGRLLLAGIPATPEWSNLPLKPEFVPLLLRATAYLRRAPPVQVTPSVRPSRPAVIRVSDLWPDAHIQAFTPDDRPHTITLHRSGTERRGALTETAQKGYYRVRAVPRAAGAPDRVDLGFAVNLDARDAEIVQQDESEILAALEPAEAVYVEGDPDDPVLASQLTARHEIWRTLIWIMFLVIGVEFMLSTLYVRRRAARSALGATARRWVQEAVTG